MLEHDMSIELRPDRLTFNTDLRHEFKPIDLDIPKFGGIREQSSFKDMVQQKVREACGISSCRAVVFMDFSSPPKYLLDAVIACSNAECPLDIQGQNGTGVREPRVPVGPDPLTDSIELAQRH